MVRHGVPRLAETFTNPTIMGRGKVTEAAAASLNNAAQNKSYNIIHADKVYEIKNVRISGQDRFGNFLLTTPEVKVPKWGTDNNGYEEIILVNEYQLTPKRLFAALYRDPYFVGFWTNRKATAERNAIKTADAYCRDNVIFDDYFKNLLVDKAIKSDLQIATKELYSNIVISGTFFPLEANEEFTYPSGISRKHLDENSIGFDFQVAVNPEYRKKWLKFEPITVPTDDTTNWTVI